MKKTIIIDNGASTIKLGTAGEQGETKFVNFPEISWVHLSTMLVKDDSQRRNTIQRRQNNICRT